MLRVGIIGNSKILPLRAISPCGCHSDGCSEFCWSLVFAAVTTLLLHQVSTGKSDSAFLHKEQLYRLFTLLFGEKSIDHPLQTKYSNLAPGIHLLQQTFLQDLPIQQFADICNISLSSFRSLFTEFYGISPLRYRNQLRINHAKTLLTETHCTISEVAERSGFDNTAYFCRLYKKIIGETPGQTRARHWE